jgi:hypothetical protein
MSTYMHTAVAETVTVSRLLPRLSPSTTLGVPPSAAAPDILKEWAEGALYDLSRRSSRIEYRAVSPRSSTQTCLTRRCTCAIAFFSRTSRTLSRLSSDT